MKDNFWSVYLDLNELSTRIFSFLVHFPLFSNFLVDWAYYI